MKSWRDVMLVACGMVAGAVLLVIATYVWVAFAIQDAIN